MDCIRQIAGVIYFIVDYDFFYLALGTRSVDGADTFMFLLWLSMSCGFTNFTWIWLILENDGRRLEWSLIPIIGWVTVSLLSQEFGAGFRQIHIQRNVPGYHADTAVILAAGYLILIIRNITGKYPKAPLATLLVTGIGVQLAWEAVLLITASRPEATKPLLINSLIETNLGVPFIYMIFCAFSKIRAPIARPIPL